MADEISWNSTAHRVLRLTACMLLVIDTCQCYITLAFVVAPGLFAYCTVNKQRMGCTIAKSRSKFVTTWNLYTKETMICYTNSDFYRVSCHATERKAGLSGTWAPSQYKDGLSRYGDFHYKDKTVARLFYFYDGDSYTGKTTFLYWDGPLAWG